MRAGAGAGERRVVVAVGLGVSVVPLDAAVNVAFPAITAAFATPVASIRWVIICYVLTYASLLLAFGRLADVLGHRRIFVFGLLWSTGAFALCALAPSFGWLLAARVV
jgi:MFS family permease